MSSIVDRAFFLLDGVLLRPYIRYVPLAAGKRDLWDRVIRPYVAWRNRHVVRRTRHGVRMNLRMPDLIQSYIYYFGVWEPNLTDYLCSALRPGDTFIDVGANVGYYTLLAAKCVGPTGEVHAIEASPAICAALRGNVDLNGFRDVTIHNLAVSDERTTIEIFGSAAVNNLGATTTSVDQAKRQDFISEGTVEAAPLDQIVARDRILRARLIKIDVEGAETKVLQGMRHLLGSLSDNTEIVVELNRAAVADTGETIGGILGMFRQHGFVPYELVNDYTPYPYLRRRPVQAPRPLTGEDFDQADIIFTKRAIPLGQ